MKMPPVLDGECKKFFLRIAFSKKLKWTRTMRTMTIAILFIVMASTQQQWNQTIQVLKQPKRKDAPINLLDIQTQCANFDSSVSSMWNNLGEKIMNASHFPEEHRVNANFTNWVDSLFRSEYQVHQLRPSVVHQPDSVAMLRILNIIHERVMFLKQGTSSTSTSLSPPPLHILVMGGSVTAGMGCGENQVGLDIPGWSNKQITCAWPARLENLFNQVLFQGEKVVKVSNLATGGASTEVGKVVMEYRLFTEEMKKSLPHVVIWAHAPNDSQEADKAAVENIHMPEFVHAVRNLRLCDNELPLAVMLDDFYGADKYSSINDISTTMYKVSSWYDLMGISHSNVVKHKLYAHFGNSSVIKDMLGGDWNLHPGMGSHIGVAWTVFFNFLKAFRTQK